MDTFFLSDLISYWDILCEYINPYKIVLWAIVGGIAGFIITVILMIIFRKTILVNRKYIVLKILSYCYLVFFPLFIGFCALQWSALHNCERQIINNIPKYLGETNHLFNTYIKAEVIKIISEETMQSTGDDILNKTVKTAQNFSAALFKSKAGESLKTEKAGITDAVYNYISGTIINTEFVRKYIVSEIKKKVGNVLLMDEKLSNEFFDIEIGKILDSGILNTVAEKHVKYIIGGFKMNVWIMFFLIIALPVVEIMISNRMHRKKLKEEKTKNSLT